MIRRNPTRIELKMEDIQEYKDMKESEETKTHSKNILGSSPNSSEIAGVAPKASLETIHSRIGYNPRPKLN